MCFADQCERKPHANETAFDCTGSRLRPAGCGQPGWYSDTPNLNSIDSPPDTPALLYPESDARNVPSCTLRLQWRASPEATGYECWLWWDSLGGSIADIDTVQDTARIVTSLRNLTKYFWKVRATNDSGASSFTAVDSFTTVAAPVAQPRLISPNVSTPDRLPRFVWNSFPCATQYHLQVSTNSSFSAVIRDTVVADTTLVFPDPFEKLQTYCWRVCGINAGGMGPYTAAVVFQIQTAVGEPEGFPKETALLQNYPNPFNPATAISYQLSAGSFVTLEVFDILGSAVVTLVRERQSPGTYTVRFDGSGLSSGVYFCRLYAGSFVGQEKMLLIK